MKDGLPTTGYRALIRWTSRQKQKGLIEGPRRKAWALREALPLVPR